MKITVGISFFLMLIKFFAWYVSRSNAILTDALESIINVIAGGFALYSLYYASRPRDIDHPYGHGKIEFFSAGIEGALIFIAGLSMVGKAIYGFFHPSDLKQLDLGLALSVITAVVNFLLGRNLVTQGKRSGSAVLTADGKHLLSDAVSTAGLIIGLLIILATGEQWIDNALTILLGSWIIFTGFRLVRESVGNLLDEADIELVKKIVKILDENRHENWIDIHNLRLVKYGTQYHIDAHATFPFYLTLEQAHSEVHSIEKLIREKTGNEVELFIHADPCVPASCSVCGIKSCPERRSPFINKQEWNISNVLPDRKHSVR